MYNGIYGEFQWEFLDGKLLIDGPSRRIGRLMELDVPLDPVNAEQAQWTAQGRIDLNRAALEALLEERRAAS